MTQSEMQSAWDSSWLDSGNQSYLESKFEEYLKDPASLDPEWRNRFDQLPKKMQTSDISHAAIKALFKDYKPVSKTISANGMENLGQAYRLYGHQFSKINPLQEQAAVNISELLPETYGLDKEAARSLHTIYCGTIAAQFMHISDQAERNWIQENYEASVKNWSYSAEEKRSILELLIAADGLEKYLGAKYPGVKRFSLEGCDSLIIGLDDIITKGSNAGIEEVVIGMAHRGRLNVLINLLGKMPSELFDQFEEKHSMVAESGDVKYHQGFASDLKIGNNMVHVSLVFNPSHLEIVDPVASGSVRARQDRRNDTSGDKVMCVLLHGDASFAGQGVVMETLNMSATPAYNIGGTIHIIINNQIGFTTVAKDARSTMYCSDLGKMISAPIFHVNADDPEAMAIAANLAFAYRNKFRKDVIIDLVGYRRMGHNEADEPAATQPIMYKKIRSHPTAKAIYAEKLISEGIVNNEEVEKITNIYRETLDRRNEIVVKRLATSDWKSAFASDWTPYGTGDWRVATNTGLPLATLKQLANARDKIPAGFTLDPRVQKIVEARIKMTETGHHLDWGYAETLAYASLLNEGYNVRMSGQDCERGTFFHRHAVWHDYNTDETYTSLCHVAEKQGRFSIYNSLLSEAAVLGFEYGYSSSEPRTLAIWEAQFGDFANGAQVVIDQFVSSGEQKWGRLSGLVMFLPHGYEGQGPEHSSARIERYLQLCAQHNIQVCIPSTPAQIYHLLRRQMLRPLRKPLIVITPKSLLRHKMAISNLDELANGKFNLILADPNPDHRQIKRVILCSGKIYYELLATKQEASKNDCAIVRVEQVYPFPEQELAAELSRYTNAKKVIWCQEEPKNQGVWYSMQHHLINCLANGQELSYAGRSDSAAPAVGYFQLHEQQQIELINLAISG